MASFQSFGGFRSIKSNEGEKSRKARSKVHVKPILKKLSHSEKNSIDLDRGLEGQDGQYQSPGSSFSFYESSKDVSFAFTETEAAVLSGRRFNHSRSISGNSHVSVATSGSGSNIGPRSGTTFVHPFQQTPRTATPPLGVSYANSLASFADAQDRDYSPMITEDDNKYDLDPTTSRISLQQHNHHHSGSSHQNIVSSQNHPPTNPNSHSQPSLINSSANVRRPSLASYRTSSFSDTTNTQPALRINTAPRSISTTPAQSSRLAHVSSQSDLNLHLAQQETTNAQASTYRTVASPASSIAPMSPFSRASYEAAVPRLRAKSDLDTATRAEHVRDARRRVLAKEQAKEEKAAREEIKQRERADNKRAQEIERRAAAHRKERDAAKRHEEIAALAEAMPAGSKHSRKFSMASSGRPSTSRSRQPHPLEPEKFLSGNYNAMETRSPPAFGNEPGGVHGVSFRSNKRVHTAKRKTNNVWTSFMIWLRTKLMRMSNNQQ
ncbi:hypothetical protein BJ170DRAFT_427687 [Xylariales sp. AK1849]|nr:hypothetical protein BJ170DRAFT_427687 [Xylariales sp. AK1849]